MNNRINKIALNKVRLQGVRIYAKNICTRGLYKLYDKQGKIVYIGISKTNVMQRICDHYREGVKEFDSFMFKDFSRFTDVQLEELEIKFIKKYKPIYNCSHNNDNKYYSYNV